MHHRSDWTIARGLCAGAAALLALAAGACSQNSQPVGADEREDRAPATADAQNTTAPDQQASATTYAAPSRTATTKTTTMAPSNRRSANAGERANLPGQNAHGADVPTPADQNSRQALSGLNEHDLFGGETPEDTAENLFQATFGREGSDFDPDVSRDGKWLVYASTQHRKTSDLYLKRVGGQTTTQLTNDSANDVMPSFSPDGKRVAFSSNRGGSWDVYIMGTNGGQPIQVTSEPSHELHPTWSPDGRTLAFSRLNPGSGKWELWTVDVASPGVSRFLAHGLLPEWSPSGDIIAFQKPRERGERFYSVWTLQFSNGEAQNPTEIASDPEFACVSPSWSPDGARLVYSAVANPGGPVVGGLGFQPTESQLWMVNIDGTGKTRLTEGSFVNVMPRWGGDGMVYFVSNRAGVENIWGLAPERAIQTASFDSESPAHAPASASAHPAPHGAQPSHQNPPASALFAPQAGQGTTAHAKPTPSPMSHEPASTPENAEHETASAPSGDGAQHDPHD